MNNLVSEFQSSLRRKGSYRSQKEALEIHSMNCSFAEKGLFYSSVVGFGVINDLQWGELDKLTNGASPDDKRDGMKYHFTWHCHCEETSASFHGSHCSILEPTVNQLRYQESNLNSARLPKSIDLPPGSRWRISAAAAESGEGLYLIIYLTIFITSLLLIHLFSTGVKR